MLFVEKAFYLYTKPVLIFNDRSFGIKTMQLKYDLKTQIHSNIFITSGL